MPTTRRSFLKLITAAAAAVGTQVAEALDPSALLVVDDPFNYPYRQWEDLYREAWSWDSVARSTHGLNCTGSCSFLVHVRDGVITREEQAADFPPIDASLPSLNPRGCQKGACYAAEYVYGDRRIKYPLIRDGARGEGRWRRASWDEALTHIADGVLDTLEHHGPDALTFFSPIPAMSPVSFASGIRLAHLLGGVVCSFYDWYCDLPPGSPITLGEQTDVAESTDWVNSRGIILWGSNPVQTRIPDAHLLLAAKYRGAKLFAILPEVAASALKADRWLPVTPGTDAALALALCQVLLERDLIDERYVLEQTDLPLLVREDTGRLLRHADISPGGADDGLCFFCGSHGAIELAPGCAGEGGDSLALGPHQPRLSGAQEVTLLDGSAVVVRTVYDRLREHLNRAFTPQRVAPIVGLDADLIEAVALELGQLAQASGGRVMILHGAGTNHWLHNDLNNRAMLLMLSLMGAIGKNGGGFNHYVGQEKCWPKEGLNALCFPGGTGRQRFQNTTLWAYIHAEIPDTLQGDALGAASYAQPLRGYLFDSVARGWMPLFPEGALGEDKQAVIDGAPPLKDPKVMFIWRGNFFNQSKGNRYIADTLYPKLDLIVSLNFQMDSTALYADVVLPAATHYEKYDLSTTDLHSYIHPFTPAITPRFESRSDWQAFRSLAQTIEARARDRGFTQYEDPLWGQPRDLSTLASDFTAAGAIAADRDACQYILDRAVETAGLSFDDLIEGPKRMEGPTSWTSDVEQGRPYTPFTHMTEARRPYHTLSGRQQYFIDHPWFEDLGEVLPTYKPPQQDPAFPLLYNTPHGRWSVHSTFRNAPGLLHLQRAGPICYLHPDDMETRGLGDNDWVRIYNVHGEVRVRVKAFPGERPGRVTLYHGWELYQGGGGQRANFNSVTGIQMKPTQLAGGYGQLHFAPNYWGPTGVQRDTRVEVEPCSPPQEGF